MNPLVMTNMQGKVIDYDIVNEIEQEDFVRKVKKLLADGWQPSGFMIHTQRNGYSSSFSYTQVMVKYEPFEQ